MSRRVSDSAIPEKDQTPLLGRHDIQGSLEKIKSKEGPKRDKKSREGLEKRKKNPDFSKSFPK